MTSSPSGAAGSWSSDAWAPITDERPSGQPLDDDTSGATGYETPGAHWSTDVDDAPDDWGLNEESAWQHQASPEAIDEATPGLGLSPRGLVVLSLASAAGVALLNLALTGGRISFFFDLCFVVSCLTLTMAVRRNALFTAGVLPPLVYAAVFAGVAIAAPDAVASSGGVDRIFLTGLADHAAGLVGGYAVALLAVAARMSAAEARPR